MSQLNSSQTFWKKFFRPLKVHPILIVAASVIIGLALYYGVDIKLAEVVRQNSYDMHMLAAEMLSESGPYVNAINQHAEMVHLYSERLEERQLAVILQVLYPEFSPERALASASKELEKATKEEEARKAIWQAGMEINQFYAKSRRFPMAPVKWLESEDLPDWLLKDIDDAINESHRRVDMLENEQTRESALASCEANRKTILVLFLGRLGSNKEEIRGKIQDFLSVAEQAEKYKRIVANKEEYVENKQQILKWAHSEQRRVKIAEAMLENDMERVCHLLTEAIEEAYEERRSQLD